MPRDWSQDLDRSLHDLGMEFVARCLRERYPKLDVDTFCNDHNKLRVWSHGWDVELRWKRRWGFDLPWRFGLADVRTLGDVVAELDRRVIELRATLVIDETKGRRS